MKFMYLVLLSAGSGVLAGGVSTGKWDVAAVGLLLILIPFLELAHEIAQNKGPKS